jgi:adenosine deaminase
MFGNSLDDEYRALVNELGFSRDEVRQLILQGIQTSWLPESRKREMAASFQNDPNW